MIHYPFGTGIDDIRTIETRGPWTAKSGGLLNVMMALPQDEVSGFFDYSRPGFDAIEQETGVNIRGLRIYDVNKIARGNIGGMEWHAVRTEYVAALGGKALWQCTDASGRETELVLDGTRSVLMPPGILHTYVALEDNTRLQVICNTLFIPEDPRTHDTYSREDFAAFQAANILPPKE